MGDFCKNILFESTMTLDYKSVCFLREGRGGGGYEIWGKHEIIQNSSSKNSIMYGIVNDNTL